MAAGIPVLVQIQDAMKLCRKSCGGPCDAPARRKAHLRADRLLAWLRVGVSGCWNAAPED